MFSSVAPMIGHGRRLRATGITCHQEEQVRRIVVGPHLHMAVRWQGIYVNPVVMLKLNMP